jgi:oligopeptide/dipeptide ABC transporter ATP-binding protein
MRQRAMIASALVMRPAVLIADEPTTALDVTIQAQILDLLKELQQEFGMAIIFISHDLAVISQIADDVLVMYLGKEMETGPVRTIIRNPQHPYTQGLINAIPRLEALDQPLTPIPGDIPSPLERPPGCVFHTRCPHAATNPRCQLEVPAPRQPQPKHLAACHLLEEKVLEETR